MKKSGFFWGDRPGEYHWVQSGQKVLPANKDAKRQGVPLVALWRNR